MTTISATRSPLYATGYEHPNYLGILARRQRAAMLRPRQQQLDSTVDAMLDLIEQEIFNQIKEEK